MKYRMLVAEKGVQTEEIHLLGVKIAAVHQNKVERKANSQQG